MIIIQMCLSDLVMLASEEKALSHCWQMFLMAENIFVGYDHGASLSKTFPCSVFERNGQIKVIYRTNPAACA